MGLRCGYATEYHWIVPPHYHFGAKFRGNLLHVTDRFHRICYRVFQGSRIGIDRILHNKGKSKIRDNLKTREKRPDILCPEYKTVHISSKERHSTDFPAIKRVHHKAVSSFQSV